MRGESSKLRRPHSPRAPLLATAVVMALCIGHPIRCGPRGRSAFFVHIRQGFAPDGIACGAGSPGMRPSRTTPPARQACLALHI